MTPAGYGILRLPFFRRSVALLRVDSKVKHRDGNVNVCLGRMISGDIALDSL